MFPGYMFIRCTWDEKQEFFRTGHVAGFLEVSDQDALLKDLLQIKKVIEVSAPVKPHPFAKVGKWVKIKSGPFQGLEGFIVSERTGFRFVVNVRMIKQAVSVDVDAEFLEPA
jgi:transcription antitermination factor NusG